MNSCGFEVDVSTIKWKHLNWGLCPCRGWVRGFKAPTVLLLCYIFYSLWIWQKQLRDHPLILHQIAQDQTDAVQMCPPVRGIKMELQTVCPLGVCSPLSGAIKRASGGMLNQDFIFPLKHTLMSAVNVRSCHYQLDRQMTAAGKRFLFGCSMTAGWQQDL